jgi:hypothetical protein
MKEINEEVRELLVNEIKKMNKEELQAFVSGINNQTFECGWGANLNDSKLMEELYKY